MGRTALALAVLLVPANLAGGSASPTRLAIALYPAGVKAGALARHYELRCNPAAGNLPHAVRACRALGRLARPFAPVPDGAVCSQIALGAQEAIISGTLRGEPIRTRFSLRDSCEIERWRRMATVVPGFPASS
jgi:hypothetical protein